MGKEASAELAERPGQRVGVRPRLLDCFGSERVQRASLEPPAGSVYETDGFLLGRHESSRLGVLMRAACCVHVKYFDGISEDWTSRLGCWDYRRGLTPFACCAVPGFVWPFSHMRRLEMATRQGRELQTNPFLPCHAPGLARVAICIAGAARTFAHPVVHQALLF